MTRRVLPALAVGFVLFSAAVAGATSIAAPGNPYAVAADASGNPMPFTIVATGFAPGTHVYAEQCDGTSPDAPQWSPTLDCDLGTATAGAAASADGRVTFDGNDRNYGFHPFRGTSPEGLFNCLAVGQTSLHNGLVDSRRCTVRVSTNNSAPTPDQVFFAIELPAPASGSSPTTTPGTSPATTGAPGGTSGSGAAGGTGGVVGPAGATGAVGAADSSGRLAFTGRWTLALAAVGFECIAVGLAFSTRRRSRRRAATRI